jgi:hypothetical protein
VDDKSGVLTRSNQGCTLSKIAKLSEGWRTLFEREESLLEKSLVMEVNTSHAVKDQ